MDRLVSMQAFTRVVDMGSFARAADSLDLPKATLTRLIQNLETHLGVKLLHRTTRRISVTSDGAAYYERCVRILADVEEAEQSLTRHNKSPKGTLSVDTTAALARIALIPNLQEFFTSYPELKLDLTINGKPIDMLQEGVDVVLRVGAVDESMVARRVGQLKLAFYASPIYLNRYGTPHELADLAQHKAVNHLSNRTGREWPWQLARGRERTEILLPSAISTNDGEIYVECAVAGHGLACLSRVMAEPYVASGRLVEVMTDWQTEELPISAMYPQNRHLSAKVRVFVNWVADIFGRHPHFGAAPQQGSVSQLAA
ncbi:HTH-type transcriptional regulator PgrR [Cupriavidus yeoncheonensis]|uniref:HTH-type transcriptional regulator PgrR n=1 Tax=Cupriavidus yeoncheonensis TaxID=1462994 RepID=A0A916IX00_9BURK|nr:LysR family transcriptional regulator [Cupriavidus yeoncheonensis]CAG2147315.1 HTH-type transcriptional regulator PgrR [Cupriavidus yeoncheonensis]